MPSLGRPGGVKIPSSFLQGYDVQGLGCTPVQELVMDQVLRGAHTASVLVEKKTRAKALTPALGGHLFSDAKHPMNTSWVLHQRLITHKNTKFPLRIMLWRVSKGLGYAAHGRYHASAAECGPFGKLAGRKTQRNITGPFGP